MTPNKENHAKTNPKGEKEMRAQKAVEKIMEEFPFVRHCKPVLVSKEEFNTIQTFQRQLNECAEWNHFN